MKKSVKRIIIGIGILAVLSGGLIGIRKALSKNKVANVTYRVEKEIYENVIEISGTISAAQEQKLQALSAGTVLAVNVEAGDYVKKGDVILQLDDSEQIYNLAKHDYSMATTRINGSQKEIALMETQRKSLVQKIADRKVTATFDGMIADLDVAVGDSLEAKDKIGTIVNTDYLTAEVEIAETDVQKLKVGQKVNFSFPASSTDVVEGYVVGWPAIGEVTSRGATIVKAKVRIDDFPGDILPNYSFTGKIEISPTVENLVVSRYAVAYDDQKNAYVELARNGEKVNVTVQQYGRDYVKILDGLKGGEVLKQLTEPKQSGWNRNSPGGSGSNNRTGNSAGGMGAMPPMGMPPR